MKKIDLLLFGGVTLVVLFGLLMVYDASSVIAITNFGDKYHYIKDQIVWVVIGFTALFFFAFFDYRRLFNLALPLLIFAILLLLCVFIPGLGSGAKGANRWINLHFFRFQPAEFVKLELALYLAAWFSHKEKGRFLAFVLLVGAVLGLVMLEPDLGTATIILSEAVIIYFVSGGSIKHFLFSAPVVALGGFILIKLESYRAARLTTFLNINKALATTSQGADPSLWHIRQVLIALGSGGIFGVGLGNSLQKYAYLPENVTDSIFPIIAEEFGLIGAVLLIIFLLLIVWRGLFIAIHAKDNFGKLLGAGISAFIGMQMIINLGSMTALFPLTGVPLPFISFGGSALVVDMASIGILLNIAGQSLHSHKTTSGNSTKKVRIPQRKTSAI
jgi:cell division protein FtsW